MKGNECGGQDVAAGSLSGDCARAGDCGMRNAYGDDSLILKRFLAEFPGACYTAYRRWAKETGERFPVGEATFNQLVEAARKVRRAA